MNSDPQQQEFDDEALSALYRQGATEQPSAELDRRILSQARNEPGKKRSGRFRFGIPLSAAAGLLVALGLARLVLHQIPEDEALLAPAPAPQLKGRQRVDGLGASIESPALETRDMVVPKRREPAEKKFKAEAAPSTVAPRLKQQRGVGPVAEPAMLDMAEEAVISMEQQLERIKRLLNQGKRERARTLLLEFKAHFPEQKLPEELNQLLEKKPGP